MPFITSIGRHGIALGLQEGIASVLDVKFGKEGRKLMPKIQPIKDLKVLRALMRAAQKAKTLDDIQNRLP